MANTFSNNALFCKSEAALETLSSPVGTGAHPGSFTSSEEFNDSRCMAVEFTITVSMIGWPSMY